MLNQFLYSQPAWMASAKKSVINAISFLDCLLPSDRIYSMFFLYYVTLIIMNEIWDYDVKMWITLLPISHVGV